ECFKESPEGRSVQRRNRFGARDRKKQGDPYLSLSWRTLESTWRITVTDLERDLGRRWFGEVWNKGGAEAIAAAPRSERRQPRRGLTQLRRLPPRPLREWRWSFYAPQSRPIVCVWLRTGLRPAAFSYRFGFAGGTAFGWRKLVARSGWAAS